MNGNHAQVKSFKLSPDGKHLSFLANQENSEKQALLYINQDNPNNIQFLSDTESDNGEIDKRFFFNPDQNHITFFQKDLLEKYSLYLSSFDDLGKPIKLNKALLGDETISLVKPF